MNGAPMKCPLIKDVDYSEGSFLFPTLQRICDVCRRSNISSNLVYLKDFELALEKKSHITFISASNDDDQSMESDSDRSMHELDEELDDPVIVTLDEFEASLSRIKEETTRKVPDDDNRALYPLLFAATLDHEDVLMACARILDECVDASLLREATSYLENVVAEQR